MAQASIDFNAPDIAAQAERASPSDLDGLPFGVIKLDDQGMVLFLSATEMRLAGYKEKPLGQNYFGESMCVNKREIYTRVRRAMEDGPVDLEFAWKGDRADAKREVRIRVQSARSGGMWLFTERD
jgi:photoactive yellow protein